MLPPHGVWLIEASLTLRSCAGNRFYKIPANVCQLTTYLSVFIHFLLSLNNLNQIILPMEICDSTYLKQFYIILY